MLLQRLATGANGVKQARYRRRPTRGHGCFNAAKKACKRAQFACAYRARVTNRRSNSNPFKLVVFQPLFFTKPYSISVKQKMNSKNKHFSTPSRVLRKKRRDPGVVRKQLRRRHQREATKPSVFTHLQPQAGSFANYSHATTLFWEVPYHCFRLLRVANRSNVAARCAQRTPTTAL